MSVTCFPWLCLRLENKDKTFSHSSEFITTWKMNQTLIVPNLNFSGLHQRTQPKWQEPPGVGTVRVWELCGHFWGNGKYVGCCQKWPADKTAHHLFSFQTPVASSIRRWKEEETGRGRKGERRRRGKGRGRETPRKAQKSSRSDQISMLCVMSICTSMSSSRAWGFLWQGCLNHHCGPTVCLGLNTH